MQESAIIKMMRAEIQLNIILTRRYLRYLPRYSLHEMI